MKSTRNRSKKTLRVSKDQKPLKLSFSADGLSGFGGLPLLEKVSRVTGFFDGAASRRAPVAHMKRLSCRFLIVG